MKYTGMPWDIWTLITPLFRERCREEGTVRSFRCRHSGYRFDTSFLSPHYGGDSGIRTHGPLRIKRFRVSPVMTTSISLRVYFRLPLSSFPKYSKILWREKQERKHKSIRFGILKTQN